MPRFLDEAVYYATAPIRLFGRSRGFRLALAALCTLAVFVYGALLAFDRLLPAGSGVPPELTKIAPPPPLPPVTRTSYVIAPVAVALRAIQRKLDDAAPRQFAGKNDNAVSSLLSKADIGITLERRTLSMAGKPNEMTVGTPVTGTLRITGQIAEQAGNITGSIAGLIDKSIGSSVGKIANQVLDQRADIHGNVTVHARPAIAADWRLLPNLASQVTLADSTVVLAGFKIDVAGEAKPLIEREVNAQIARLETRLRNDPMLERAAREQWAKLCRSIALGGGETGLPRLWLEMKPIRAAAAQPQIDAQNMTLTIGVQAETRITERESKPNCPFPAALELVPPMQNGKLSVGLPIDVPFAALNKALTAQLKGRIFPENADAAVSAEVRGVALAAAGERLLITLKVRAREQKSWFGLGADATIHVWGKPVLDDKNQVLRLSEIALAVDTEAGLLSAAARAALPYLQQALADQAAVDLKPFAADARKKITLMLAEFRQPAPGTRADAVIDELRLTGIAFDAHTLRITAEAAGSVKVAVSELPKM